MRDQAEPYADVVERAQQDPEYRARLLADPRSALAEVVGAEVPDWLVVRVVEEQPGEPVLVVSGEPGHGKVDDETLAGVAGGGLTWLNSLVPLPPLPPFPPFPG